MNENVSQPCEPGTANTDIFNSRGFSVTEALIVEGRELCGGDVQGSRRGTFVFLVSEE